jgi:hypothetical protein
MHRSVDRCGEAVNKGAHLGMAGDE